MNKSESINQALEILSAGAERMNEPLSPDTVAIFEKFLENLAAYNEHTNLVSNAEPQMVVNSHVLDSLTLLQFLAPGNGQSQRLIDIGSGAGFPGLILAIVRPDLQVTLLDSVEKKTRFLAQQKSSLNLKNVRVLTERAEAIGHHREYRSQFDYATARAVASLDTIAELTIPLLKNGGKLLLQKSAAQVEDEEHCAAKTLPILGARLDETRALTDDFTERAFAVMVISKVSTTAQRFPRDWKFIKAEPLSQT